MRRAGLVCVLLAVALAALGAGCRRGGRVFVAKASVGNGVKVEATGQARVKGDYFSVDLVATNDTVERIEVNRNQIALVAPDGREFYRDGGREIHWLEPHGQHDVSLTIRIDPSAFNEASGAYLRFNGFYVGTIRVDIPPMPLGAPTGSFNRWAVPKAKSETAKGRYPQRAVNEVSSPASGTTLR
jgi:hypothetical protein